MKINLHNAEFLLSAPSKREFIHNDLPKIAFAGRSNVGKSSTINALLNRNGFARTSVSPGKTAHVNYFLIDKKLYFIDLPGYGYAKVAKTERDRWGNLMEDFFATGSQELTLCILIVDIRHAPTKDDCTMNNYFAQTGCNYIVVANKADNIKKRELEPNISRIREVLELNDNIPVIPISAKKKEGVDKLLEVILTACDKQ